MSHIMCKRHQDALDHPIPKRAKEGDAGFDLYCNHELTVQAGDEATIALGVDVKVPEGSVGIIMPRSSANKLGLHVKVGVIDSGYTGPMFAMVHNIGKKPVKIERGMRICQLLPFTVFPVQNEMVEVAEMPHTERGTSGFGSTGGDAKHS